MTNQEGKQRRKKVYKVMAIPVLHRNCQTISILWGIFNVHTLYHILQVLVSFMVPTNDTQG